MSNVRRPKIKGGTYFITQITHQRIPWLCTNLGRQALREAIAKKKSISLRSDIIEKALYKFRSHELLRDHYYRIRQARW